jgi:hypothetical protein
LAVSKGYHAAGIDLGNLLTDETAGAADPVRAVSLFEKAWRDGVPIAAYALGHLYETGAGVGFHTDVEKAWAWYQKGADAGEPTALARFGERDDRDALAEKDPLKANARLLRAFQFYAAAAGRAHDEAWMDEAWKSWRYRRATLARLLAHEGMMPQAADAYRAAQGQGTSRFSGSIQRRLLSQTTCQSARLSNNRSHNAGRTRRETGTQHHMNYAARNAICRLFRIREFQVSSSPYLHSPRRYPPARPARPAPPYYLTSRR